MPRGICIYEPDDPGMYILFLSAKFSIQNITSHTVAVETVLEE